MKEDFLLELVRHFEVEDTTNSLKPIALKEHSSNNLYSIFYYVNGKVKSALFTRKDINIDSIFIKYNINNISSLISDDIETKELWIIKREVSNESFKAKVYAYDGNYMVYSNLTHQKDDIVCFKNIEIDYRNDNFDIIENL